MYAKYLLVTPNLKTTAYTEKLPRTPHLNAHGTSRKEECTRIHPAMKRTRLLQLTVLTNETWFKNPRESFTNLELCRHRIRKLAMAPVTAGTNSQTKKRYLLEKACCS